MSATSDSNPENEYADDEYADRDAEDRAQPSTPAEIPDDEPEADVLEQREEVPYADEEDAPAELRYDETAADVPEQRDEARYGDGDE
jgi:hypothetical protein